MLRLFIVVLIVVFSVSTSVAGGDDDETPIYQPQEPITLTDFGRAFGRRVMKQNDSPTVRPITVAIVDSGIDYANPYIRNKVVESKSFTDGDCGRDSVGHGTLMALLYDNVKANLICVQVIKRNYSLSSAGVSGWGTLSQLLEGLAYVSTLDVDIVNLSLVGYPETPELFAAISKLEEKAVVVMAAGNDNFNKITSPCRFAHTLFRSVICVIGANYPDGDKSDVSNWGSEADVANYGRYTSLATANTGYEVEWLMSLIPLDAPRPSPAFFKKLVLLGASYTPLLKGLVGDPDRGLDARLVDGGGAFSVLSRLQKLRLISYWPIEVHVGTEVRITISEDPLWLGNFFPAFDKAAVPRVVLNGSAGNTIVIEGQFFNGELHFKAPRAGDWTAQLVIEGLPVGDKLRIHVAL